MTIELSFINWDVLDEEDRPLLPSEYKINVIFYGETSKIPVALKGHIIAKDLSDIFGKKTREGVYPRDFLWKSSKSSRMHKWSYDMDAPSYSVFIVRHD